MRLDRWTLMGVSLVGFGLLLAIPSRNLRGAPGVERLLDQCRLPNGAVVRLYHGEPHATVSDWYSLSYDPPGLGRERQIVFNEFASYATLRCDEHGVTMITPNGVGISTLTQDEAERMPRPGENNPLVWLQRAEAVLLLGVGLVLIRRSRRAIKPATRAA